MSAVARSDGSNESVKKRFDPAVLQERLVNLFESAPLSCCAAVLGVSLHFSFTFFPHVTPMRTYLYHPKLATQLHRNITGFAILGVTTFEVINRVVGILVYQSAVERRLNGEGDTYANSIVVKRGVQRLRPDGTRKTLVEWLVTENLFLRVQAALCAVLLALEVATQGFGSTSDGLVPYTMFANLEFALRWLWAFTATEESITMFGFIPVKSVLLPIFLVTIQRFRTAGSLAKGFIAAAVVSHVMKLKRADGKENVPWFLEKMKALPASLLQKK
ncbi:hypothetical protein SmJEL517_g02725 [Synchytrium microbalum]|uniref:Derlin n=1 Tax=Synchytrium microbalum TaxID=1806994 RepID=A0A507C0P5_9FUNG|nr:uncharacterized protein SmJEL517_g02725 [Synchytrium microbalum]TPX34657.1 hypothetical protein SmJEL517_g02725 [Synchytrium microbalum]